MSLESLPSIVSIISIIVIILGVGFTIIWPIFSFYRFYKKWGFLLFESNKWYRVTDEDNYISLLHTLFLSYTFILPLVIIKVLYEIFFGADSYKNLGSCNNAVDPGSCIQDFLFQSILTDASIIWIITLGMVFFFWIPLYLLIRRTREIGTYNDTKLSGMRIVLFWYNFTMLYWLILWWIRIYSRFEYSEWGISFKSNPLFLNSYSTLLFAWAWFITFILILWILVINNWDSDEESLANNRGSYSLSTVNKLFYGYMLTTYIGGIILAIIIGISGWLK